MIFTGCKRCENREFMVVKTVCLDEIVTINEDGTLVDSGTGTESESAPNVVYEGFVCTQCGENYTCLHQHLS